MTVRFFVRSQVVLPEDVGQTLTQESNRTKIAHLSKNVANDPSIRVFGDIGERWPSENMEHVLKWSS